MKWPSSPLGVLVKWIWIGLVVVAVVAFAITRRQVIVQDLARFSPPELAAVAVLLLLGKLGMNVAMLLATRHCAIPVSRRDGFYMYNLAQLAKYVPGSIWQFVSRIAMLRARQAPAVAIRDSILAENAWVVGSALVIGVVLLGLAQPAFYLRLLEAVRRVPPALAVPLGAVLLALAGALTVALPRLRRRSSRLVSWLIRLRPPGAASFSLLLGWFALGASFWLCLRPFLAGGPAWPAVIGVYCLAWVAGYLVPFAPAGLGVREVVLALALDPFIAADTSLVVVAVHRVVYLLVEVLLALVALALGPDPAAAPPSA
ncbi:lysylphosphatidylglycerol synthase domain-containing protein [Cyanobium gracile UHCC 0139]|uniref:Lysylphosphatidylglycerol synthase domain-containing protein n=1 Tax=Cyanobium gracile UHCC 0139 TaxID=3110308 RepID=A0ABU5RV20_9CYAN|nr:lysylphosphatidylglycerol synthase domain-containing protein [Cyanobium gracile]MEA5391596.1 lysylphosphatidylglycerol synthase domain-containing protein [Cyanobium gracile UHCC 0139]